MKIEDVRRQAQSRVDSGGLPKPGEEAWRFTPLSAILDKRFVAAEPVRLTGSDAAKLYLAPISCYRLVFHNGRFVPELSRIPDGLKVGSVLAGVEEALLLGEEESGFGALAAAKFQDGPYVRVPRGMTVDKPIHIAYVGTAAAGKPQEAHYRGVIILESGASAIVVEESVGRGAGDFFTNSVTRVELGDGARLEHYTFLREPENAFFSVREFRARLCRDARLKAHAVCLGGALVRCDAVVRLLGEGSDAELNGLYAAGGRQHFDFHTTVIHATPHGSSRELYKGVLSDHARAVFNGLVEVQPGAQKTEALVYNRNLLLSEGGLVNTKPEFKIHANDVICKHGATIGQLRPDALFYLRSRGIGLAQARSLLVFAFASEMLGRMALEPVRDALSAKMQALAGVERA